MRRCRDHRTPCAEDVPARECACGRRSGRELSNVTRAGLARASSEAPYVTEQHARLAPQTSATRGPRGQRRDRMAKGQRAARGDEMRATRKGRRPAVGRKCGKGHGRAVENGRVEQSCGEGVSDFIRANEAMAGARLGQEPQASWSTFCSLRIISDSSSPFTTIVHQHQQHHSALTSLDSTSRIPEIHAIRHHGQGQLLRR